MSSMSEGIKPRAIVTSANKVKLLSRLKNFWSMKSIMIQAKAKPELLNDPVFQEQAIEYFEKNTKLTTQKFWTQMDHETQLKATQYFILQEITETKYTRIIPTKDNAALYIILSGAADVKEGTDGPEMSYVAGDMFGNLDLFCTAVSEPENLEGALEEVAKEQNVITATMEKGSYIRINLADFHRFVMGINDDSEAAEKRAVEEDAKVAGIRAEDLTQADRFLVNVYRRARRLLDPDLFAFLDAYKLVPKHSREKNARFYDECEHNKPLPPSKDKDPLELIIVLYGNIRVDIEALNKGTKHALGIDRTNFATKFNAKNKTKSQSFITTNNVNDRHEMRRQQIMFENATEQRKKEEMVVLTGTLPLMRQGEGSLLFLTPAAKMVGLKDEDYDDPSIHLDSLHKEEDEGIKHPDQGLAKLLLLKSSPQPQNQQKQRQTRQMDITKQMFNSQSEEASVNSGNSLPPSSAFPSPINNRKNKSLLAKATTNAASSIFPTAKESTKSVNNSNKKALSNNPLYKINLICEGHTTFLRIPYRYIQRILNEDSINRGLILRPMAVTIQSQLLRAGERLVKSIQRLLPWLGPPPPQTTLITTENDDLDDENGDLKAIDSEAREKRKQGMDGILHLKPPIIPVLKMPKEDGDPKYIPTPDIAALEQTSGLMGTYGQNILPRRGRVAYNNNHHRSSHSTRNNYNRSSFRLSRSATDISSFTFNTEQEGDAEDDNATSTLSFSTDNFTTTLEATNPNINPKRNRRRSSMISNDETQRQALMKSVKERLRSKQLAPITLRSSIVLKPRRNSLTDRDKAPLLSSISSLHQSSLKGSGLKQPSFQLPVPILEEAAGVEEESKLIVVDR